MGARGVTPCTRCALAPILDEVAAGATETGYHALICTAPHTTGPCPRCADLTAYACARAYLVADDRGWAGVLRPGVSDAGANNLAMLGLEVLNASGDLPPITAPMWGAAAALLPGTGTLTEALAAAVALYATPTTGDRP